MRPRYICYLVSFCGYGVGDVNGDRCLEERARMGAGAGQSLSVDRLRGQSDGGLALGSISEAKRSGLLGLSPFYLVGRVATVLGASARAIRYYEERGLLDPSRVGTVRQYTRQQLERARFVVDARRADITIANIKILAMVMSARKCATLA